MASPPPKKLYADRDPSKLEPHYCRHISAMTSEGLHSKSDIAAELAWRDRALETAVALLIQCKTCRKPATRAYPTAELGYYVYGCDDHRQGPDVCEHTDQEAHDLKQAVLVRSLGSTDPEKPAVQP